MQTIETLNSTLWTAGIICLSLVLITYIIGKIKRALTIALIALILLLSGNQTAELKAEAELRGADVKATLSEILNSLEDTPKEDILPEDLSGSIVIFYRFGCPDCKAIYPELKDRLSDIPDVYYVLSRSEQGEKLRESYPISSVPVAIYFSTNGTSHYTYELDKQKEGITVLNTENLERLLALKEQQR